MFTSIWRVMHHPHAKPILRTGGIEACPPPPPQNVTRAVDVSCPVGGTDDWHHGQITARQVYIVQTARGMRQT